MIGDIQLVTRHHKKARLPSMQPGGSGVIGSCDGLKPEGCNSSGLPDAGSAVHLRYLDAEWRERIAEPVIIKASPAIARCRAHGLIALSAMMKTHLGEKSPRM